ncbi:MAG: hypothetical protein M9922_08290 [Microthrixaceae bacterium]|nr:hypothetical protein [Microthrixaceae bacterium]
MSGCSGSSDQPQPGQPTTAPNTNDVVFVDEVLCEAGPPVDTRAGVAAAVSQAELLDAGCVGTAGDHIDVLFSDPQNPLWWIPVGADRIAAVGDYSDGVLTVIHVAPAPDCAVTADYRGELGVLAASVTEPDVALEVDHRGC